MVAEDEGVGNAAPDQEVGKLEHGGLGVGRCFAVYLVAREDNEVGGLEVEGLANKIQGSDVGIAVSCGGILVTADSKAGGKVHVGDLEDLEFAIFPYPWLRLGERFGMSLSDRETWFGCVAVVVHGQGLVLDLPSRPWIDGVGTEQYINRGDSFLGVGSMRLC